MLALNPDWKMPHEVRDQERCDYCGVVIEAVAFWDGAAWELTYYCECGRCYGVIPWPFVSLTATADDFEALHFIVIGGNQQTTAQPPA